MYEDVLSRILDRTTDNFDKSEGSNFHKFSQLVSHPLQQDQNLYYKVFEWLDIDKAKGKALDRFGNNVGQIRGQLGDDVYRVLIKSKIKRALSNGSIPTMIDFLSFLLQIPPSSVQIDELWEKNDGREAKIYVNVPAYSIAKTGFSLAQFGQLVNSITSAGVGAEVLFEGTFSFSSKYTESEYNQENGLANEEMTVGGTLGYVYDPAFDIKLPI